MKRQAQIAFFGFISSLISTETGSNYLDLELGNEFWNRVRVSGSCYKSLAYIMLHVTNPVSRSEHNNDKQLICH